MVGKMVGKEQLLDAMAVQGVEVDDIAKAQAPAFRKRWEQLMSSKKGRAPMLWRVGFEELNIPDEFAGFTMQQLSHVETARQTKFYADVMNAIATVAYVQAYSETVERAILTATSKQAKAVLSVAKELSLGDLKAAAKEGPKARMENIKEARKNAPVA